jgi:hypothetical protein
MRSKAAPSDPHFKVNLGADDGAVLEYSLDFCIPLMEVQVTPKVHHAGFVGVL